MSFPNVVYIKHGDEKIAQSTKVGGTPLGQLFVLPDNSMFVHSKASTAAAMTAAYMGQGGAVDIADTMLVKSMVLAATVTAGARTVTLTTGGTAAFLEDQYADGYLLIPAGTSAANSSNGRRWAIASNNSAAAASATVTLTMKEPIDITLPAGTVVVGVRENPYWGVVVVGSGTAMLGPVTGVPPVAVSAGFYFLSQVRGPAECFVAGTVLAIGDPVVCSSAVAGAVAAIAATTITDAKGRLGKVGYSMTLGAANGNALVDLQLL